MIHWRPDAILRPVDWRWRLASKLVESGRPARRSTHDRYVHAAVAFLKDQASCRDEWELVGLQARWPDLFDAREMWAQGSPSYRYELEARLLARGGLARAAERSGIRPEVVEWYEALFFHTQDRLDNPSFVVHQVFGPSVHTGLSDRQYDLFWKLLAYAGGHVVLDAVLCPVARAEYEPERPQQVTGFYNDQSRHVLARQNLHALLTLRATDGYVKLQLMEINRGYAELEAQSQAGAGQDSLLRGLSALVSGLRWELGPRDGAMHAEPRARDLMARAVGAPGGPVIDMPEPEFRAEEAR